MNEYITADGHMKVERYGRGLRILYATADGFKQDDEDPRFLPGFATSAVREFFRAEEDERLGRWRWPDDPELVVYPLEDSHSARVLHEPSGQILTYKRGEYPDHKTGYSGAGNAYFHARPEPKPAWYDAQVGEVWVLDIDHHHAQKEVAWQVATNGQFSRLGLALSKKDDRITAGRRIWPES